ncbi:MAG: hypothetical protein ABIQ02_10105 [Saprospiraceae bacterium]
MNKFVASLIIFALFIPFSSWGQGKPNYVGQWYQHTSQGKTPVKSEAFQADRSDYPRTKKYNLKGNIRQLNSIMNTKPELLNLVVPYGDKIYTLNLAKVDVIASDFSVKTDKGNGNHKSGVQYRGIVDGHPDQLASLSLTPTDKSAVFSTPEGNFEISKAGSGFAVYNTVEMELPAITPTKTFTTL